MKTVIEMLKQVMPMEGEDGDLLPSLHTLRDIEAFAALVREDERKQQALQRLSDIHQEMEQQEPVAWRYKITPPYWTYSDKEPNKDFAGDAWGRWEVTPLYAFPMILENESQKPIAWAVFINGTIMCVDQKKKPYTVGGEVKPLYTTPPTAVQAALPILGEEK